MNEVEFALEILFSRITFYSGMVRERACDEIAKLLNYPNYYEKVFNRLLLWTENQTLESLNILSVIILIRAKDLNPSIVLPDFRVYKNLFHYNSLITWLLFGELYANRLDDKAFNYNFSEAVPIDFLPDNYFMKYIRSFIPPIYYDNAVKLEKEKGLPFIKSWGWEWSKLLERDEIIQDKSIIDYWGRNNEYHYVAFDPKMSEYYRSSYLRTINRFLNGKRISFAEALILSLKVIPIDFELWKIKSNEIPKWIPQLYTKGKEAIDTSCSIIFQQIQHTWSEHDKNDFIISECSCLIGESEIYNEFEIYGFFQKTYGAKEPELEKLSTELRWGNTLGKGGKNLLRFGGELKPNLFDSNIIEMKDWDIVSCALRAKPFNLPRWQWWRMYRDVWFPSLYFLNGETLIEINDSKISFIDDRNEIGYWFDWSVNLREQNLANLPPSTGQALMIKKDLIKKIEDERGFNFCWLCKLTNFSRKYSHEEFKEYPVFKTFGVSKIII